MAGADRVRTVRGGARERHHPPGVSTPAPHPSGRQPAPAFAPAAYAGGLSHRLSLAHAVADIHLRRMRTAPAGRSMINPGIDASRGRTGHGPRGHGEPGGGSPAQTEENHMTDMSQARVEAAQPPQETLA